MIVARATIVYCILCGRRKESVAVSVMTHQHRRKLTQHPGQNNNIADTITHKQSNIINDYDYEMWWWA